MSSRLDRSALVKYMHLWSLLIEDKDESSHALGRSVVHSPSNVSAVLPALPVWSCNSAGGDGL